MTSVDELFKKPGLPSKRKLEVSHDPSEYYNKSAKLTTNGDAKGHSHNASVEEEIAEDDEDIEAGPAPPPIDEDGEDGEDYGPNDDEDGRFFGGGTDSTTLQAMQYVDQHEEELGNLKDEVYDIKWLRAFSLKFERTISKNAELRSKYPDDATKFMASEADLDTQIKELSILAEHTELYEEFAKQGCVGSLVGLLAHENADVAIDAVQAIGELIDEDVEAEEEEWRAVVDAALEADLLSLLTSNFERLDENEETDREGIYTALGILESLASNVETVEVVGKEGPLIGWLLSRIQRVEKTIGRNKLYSAEVLSILAQSSPVNRIALASADAVNITLELLAPYRRRDPPKDTEEEEFVENLFDALISLVDSSVGKDKFVAAEGVELLLIMLRDGKMTKSRALRVLDHATSSSSGGAVCAKVVEKQGLKTLFGLFMKDKTEASSVEHLLGIFASMLRALLGDSAERIRLLAKFMEKDYEKIARLISIRRQYASRLREIELQIERERRQLAQAEQEAAEDEWFSRRLDAGLFVLQSVDTILAWLVAEDSGARKKVVALLSERDESLANIRATLEGQMIGVTEDNEEAKGFKEMLSTLIEFVG
jgi:beta-catenin-like protein 1